MGCEVIKRSRDRFLLTAMGKETYKILCDICDLVLLKKKIYSQLCELLTQYFIKPKATFEERIQFYKITQTTSESVNKWYLGMKSLASNCNFGVNLNIVLKDKFVCGLLRGPIQDRACKEDEFETLLELLQIALKKEAVSIRVTAVNRVKVEPNCPWSGKSKHGVYPAKQASRHQALEKSAKLCYAYGKDNNKFIICKYRSYACKLCKQILIRNSLIVSKNDDLPIFNMLIINMLSLSKDDIAKPILCYIFVNDIPLEIEVDTGAGVFAISYDIYLQHFANCEIQVAIRYSDNYIDSKLVVIQGDNNKPLLSRDLISKLKLKLNMNKLDSMKATEDLELNKLLDTFKKLFTPGLVPFAFKEKMEEELDKLEKLGVIRKIDTSEWGTTLVPALKKDGFIRVCADYKSTVNKYLKDVRFPLLRTRELFAVLQGGESFTHLDFSQAYNQLVLEEDTQNLLAWNIQRGLYAVQRLLFGTKPACSIFQRIVDTTLKGVPGTINFLDDVVVTGRTRLEHLKNLEVFTRLSKVGFKLQLSKCRFFQAEIKYLGYKISNKGLRKDESKVEAMVNTSEPRDVSQLRTFLCLVIYYGKFVHNLANQLKPLFRLLEKNSKFVWSQDCQVAFRRAKELIALNIILVHFNPQLPYMCFASSSATKGQANTVEQENYPLDRVHLDFLGSTNGKMYLLLTNLYSKSPEVYYMSSTTAEATIDKLRETFSRFGLPNNIVTDNGTQFTASEFAEFCQINSIQHVTNGTAKNAVKSFKQGFYKLAKHPRTRNDSIETLINR
ncbi:hypothetical protein ILUMI_24727 [Ignelater luminosus]|uniref:RNA-directed DNA polymerase n=1 Tax=Ignelater luminosus TaxID=2038154 RepID=A0A8K0C9Y1_IGNLU|nr:hypothetical protein ILUMI_24727 [Ignelater luminosus]